MATFPRRDLAFEVAKHFHRTPEQRILGHPTGTGGRHALPCDATACDVMERGRRAAPPKQSSWSPAVRRGGHAPGMIVVDAADLIVLKLVAGGPQDLLDISLLLAAVGKQRRDEAERRMADLPGTVRKVRKALLGVDPGD